MMDNYFNQDAALLSVSGTNEYGEPITTEIPVKVRWQGGRRLVRDAQGNEVVAEVTCFCREEIKPGDIMLYAGGKWPVIAVMDKVDLEGNALYREVAL